MKEVYIVIDNYPSGNYKDIVLGVYNTLEKAEECKLSYELSIAVRDTNRFKVITETIE